MALVEGAGVGAGGQRGQGAGDETGGATLSVCVCEQALSDEHQKMISDVPVEEQRVIH